MKPNLIWAALFAACIMLAVMVPAVAAADYPHNGQFIAYYNSSALVRTAAPSNAGTTYVNTAATANTASQAMTTGRITPLVTLSSTDWPQFLYNATHAGFSPATGLPSNNSTVWWENLTAISTTNPLIVSGNAYILTGYAGFDEPDSLTSINLTCMNVSTGSILWQSPPLSRTVHYGSYSSPTTDGTYVYVSTDYTVYAIRVSDGSIAWTYTTSDVNLNGGPTVGGNSVFVSDWGSGSGGHYYNLSKTTGVMNWVFTDANMNYVQGSPAYDSADGSIYVTAYNYSGTGPNGSGSYGYIYKVNASGGKVWSEPTLMGEIFGGSASFDATRVYAASYNFNGNGTLYAYNKNSGKLAWSKSIEPSDATPTIANGIVYISGGTSGFTPPGVYAFYANNGTPVWSRVNQSMGGWTDSVSVANGYAFTGYENDNSGYPDYCYNTTYALNAATGATVWFYPQGGATAAIAQNATGNGKVYTLGNNGYLYRFG